jgi:hypothetical protein
MKLIESKTLGTAQASIEFTSIPQDGTDLVVLVSSRRDQSGTTGALGIRLNGDTGSNYSARTLSGNGSSASSFATTTYGYAGETGNSTDTSNTFASSFIYIPNYTSGTAKSYGSDSVTENNATTAFQSIAGGLWTGTSAITTVTIFPQGGNNLVTGSTISLYKITKGTSSGVIAS